MTALLTDYDQHQAAAPHPAIPLPPRCNVLGVGISAVNLDSAAQLIASWIAGNERQYVCVTGVHGVMESQSDAKLQKIHNRAGMVTPDGMPMVWLNKLAGNSHVTRVYGPDLMLKVCGEGVARRTRHYFYGGGDGVAELLSTRLQERFPGLNVVGKYCPPFRKLTAEEDAAIVAEINQACPDIIWVGLSTPKQEFWMDGHIGRIEAPVMIGVGAAFDFHAGLKSQAPSFMQKSGLEWFYRLLTEPRRLWKRYLINNPKFLTYLLLSKLGLRRRSMDV